MGKVCGYTQFSISALNLISRGWDKILCDTVSTLNQIPTDMHVCLKDSSEREIFFIAMSP